MDVIKVVWLLFATTKSAHGLIVDNPFLPGSISELSTNWNQLFGFQNGGIGLWVGNSAIYAVGALLITLVASIPAGYAMALTEFRFRRALLIVTLIVMLIPNTALVLPIFLELNVVGLIGSPLSVILPMSFFPFGVYLTYIYFSTSIPRDLLAAARIDGCSEIQVFARIALPLAAPVVALVAFFSFVQNWNNYFLPLAMLSNTQLFPITVGLGLWEGQASANNSGGHSLWGLIIIGSLVSIVPLIIAFLSLQKYWQGGLSLGALK